MVRRLEVTPIEQLIAAVDAIVQQGSASPSEELVQALSGAWESTNRGMLPRAFHAAVEQAPAAISITDLDARILYANPMFEQVTGHAVDEVVGRNESILSDRRTPRHVYEAMWRHLQAGRSWSGQLVNRRKDRSRYLAELTISPLRDTEGTVIHYLGIHRDVTDIYRLEQRVRNQKRLIESIIDSAPVAMVLLGDAGGEELSNRAYRELAMELVPEPLQRRGETLANILLSGLAGRLPVEPLDPSNPGPIFHDEEVALGTDGVSMDGTSPEALVPPGGEGPRWFSCSASWLVEVDEEVDSFFEPRERGYRLLVITEVTRLKQQQAAVRRNALRALVAEEARVEALRETIDAAAFQLQSPFNLLRAAMKLRARKGEGGGLDDVLEQVLAAGSRAIDMLHDAMPRAETGVTTALDMNMVVGDILALSTERMLAAGVVVDWWPSAGLPVLQGHENRLRAMVKQLLDNALDALEEQSAEAPREIRARLDVDDGELILHLEDSGPGIPPEVRGRIFEPFFTTRPERGRGGMGLPIVREVLNQHGAGIEFDHARPGCCLTIHFPLPPRGVPEGETGARDTS